MADYFSQTVVQPFIPADAITPLELALLTHMYEHEAVDDAIYFFSSEGPSEMVWLDIAELRELLADEPIVPGGVAELIRDKLTDAGPDEAEIELESEDDAVLASIERASLEREAKRFAARQGYVVDWDSVGQLDDATLVNGIAQVAPFDAAAKQALLEATPIDARAELVVQLMQFFGRFDGDDGRATLQ